MILIPLKMADLEPIPGPITNNYLLFKKSKTWNKLMICWYPPKVITFFQILAISSLFYDEPGGCANSVFLEFTTAVDSFNCLSKCISYIDEMGTKCYFSTFISYPPDIYVHQSKKCLLFQTCTKLETSSCMNCLTSTYADAAQCDKPGVCVVSIKFGKIMTFWCLDIIHLSIYILSRHIR